MRSQGGGARSARFSLPYLLGESATIPVCPIPTRTRRLHRDDSDSASSEGEETTGMIGEAKNFLLNGPEDNDEMSIDMSKNGVVTPATEAEVPTGEPGPKTNGEHMEAGMDCNIKKLYSGKEDKRGRFQWQTTPPEDVKDPVENSETAKYALLVRNTKVYNNPRKTMAIHSIVVQSPFLKKLLQNVLRDYPGITVNLRRLELAGKFEPLIHRWGRLKEAISKLGDETEEEIETKRHADLLFDVLATEFKDLIDSSQDMMSKGVMTFEYLWTIFQPGALVYTRQDGQDTALKLVSAKYGMDSNGVPVLWLSGKYVDWDGSRFGTNKINIKIGQYAGTRKIAALNALPLEYHPDREALRERLDARGKRVEELAGSYYRQYHGVGWKLSPFGGKDKYNIKGRVVIDTYGWNRFNPNNAIFVSALTAKDPQAMQIGENAESLGDDGYEDDMDADDGGMPIDGHFLDEDDASKRMPLSVEQRVICTPLIRGYSLKTKLWLNFFVNSVSDITWNKGAFDRLVLPAQQKELILGFTESQKSYKDGFDDIIEGKGRGMILLLCGPPGVGKTLTAESVAEEMQVPLYMMSAGDLGLDPRTVETSLKDILEMCTKWNAILLLDEADVFLEQRSLHELERNKLVSIFLRVLEYYEGIMFLTTNRVNTFDAAFQSRIHISLDYPELSIESRRTVWSNFLTASNVEHTISTGQLNELARMSMNGRQIKNVLKTAQLLARRKNAKLGHEHITAVLDCTQHLHNSTRETERTRSAIFC